MTSYGIFEATIAPYNIIQGWVSKKSYDFIVIMKKLLLHFIRVVVMGEEYETESSDKINS